MRRWTVVAAIVLAACGEPAVDVSIPEREPGRNVADLAGILDVERLESQLAQTEDVDIVALTYETEQASCGEAFRAATEFVQAWQADIALVAVARPGDFGSDDEQRQRCLGVQPLEGRSVPAALREQIAEELIPPRAAVNDWDGAFAVAVDALVQQ